MRELTGPDLLATVLADPHRPRWTWYGDAGARTELSGASLANWSAKVAGLLRDELGLDPGARVSVLLDDSWQLAPILLGAWWAGVTVLTEDDGSADAAFVPEGTDPSLGAADEVFVVSRHPFGLPVTDLAAHQRDFSAAVLPQADRFGARPDASLPALDDLTLAELLDRAPEVEASARVRAHHPLSAVDTAALLVAVFRADGSLVLTAADASEPAGEGITARI